MPQVQIPQVLFDQIETVVSATTSLEEFVVQAVREKLSSEERKSEFYRLSEETRAAMLAKDLTEADVLADFEAMRKTSNGFDRA
jgi:hypothetical protein